MKNNLNIILLLLLSPVWLFGQFLCDEDDILTDPDVVQGAWDWRTHPLIIFEHTSFTGTNQYSPFPNPFFNYNNLNTSFLVEEGAAPLFNDLRDYQPKDGWELLHKEVGGEYNSNIGVTNPIFVLYNKHLGVLRVFISISDKKSELNRVIIKLKILNNEENPQLIGNANLALSSPIAQPLDGFTTDQTMMQINRWEEQDDYWLFAEFPIGYDPCVCFYESRFHIEASMMMGGNLNIENGGKTPTSEKIVVAGNENRSLNATYETIVTFNKDKAEAALIHKVGVANLEKTITNVLKLTESINSVETNISRDITKAKVAAKEASFQAPEWLKAIPKIETTVDVLDFLITGVDDRKTVTGGSRFIETNGSLESEIILKGRTIVASGAQKGTIAEQLVPKYNNPLGVFNLVETPEVEYVEYEPNIKQVRYRNALGSKLQVINFPTIREYIVSKDLVYTLNPHANVEVVNMDVSLVYTPKIRKIIVPCDDYKAIVTASTASIYGPVEIGDYNLDLSYENRLFTQDIILNYEPSTLEESIEGAIYSTPVKSQHCFKYTKFKVFHWNNLGETEIKCKIILTLKAKNSDKEFLMIHTYPVKTKVSSENIVTKINTSYEGLRQYYFKDLEVRKGKDFAVVKTSSECLINFPIANLDPSPFNTANYEYPSNVIISDRHFSQDEEITAWSSIMIGKNVTADPDVKLTLQAGKSVNFLDNTIVDFNIETLLEEPSHCPVVNSASLDRISQLCQSSKYKELSQLKIEEERIPKNLDLGVSFKGYPIPFKDNLSLEFNLDNETTISLIITNVLGQEIERLIDERIMSSGTHQINYDGSQLISGVYFATIQSKTVKKIVKLIKQ